MSTFEEDVHAIWHATCDREDAALMTAVRIHPGYGGLAAQPGREIAALAKMGHTAGVERLCQLVAHRWVERVRRFPGGWSHRVTPTEGVAIVRHESPPGGQTPKPARRANGNPPGGQTETRPAGKRPYIGSLVGSDVATEQSSTNNSNRGREADVRGVDSKTEALVDGVIQGNPLAPMLRPLGVAAADVLGQCPYFHTLEQWFRNGYTADRVRFGCTSAKQAAAGKELAFGALVVSASRWMQNARPEEYGDVKPTATPRAGGRADVNAAWAPGWEKDIPKQMRPAPEPRPQGDDDEFKF